MEATKKLAEFIGLNLDDMDGFGGTQSWSGLEDPIVFLLNHSDCDGIMTPTICKTVANRLMDFMDELDEYDQEHTSRLISLMTECYEKGVDLIFC